jgi:hypothetical protein
LKIKKSGDSMNLKEDDFSTLCVKISKEITFDSLGFPGIFGVQCNLNGRLIIISSESLLCSLESFFKDVLTKKIDNKELLHDLEKYGKAAFTFFVFAGDFELENRLKREVGVNYYKDLYREILY